MSPSLIRILLLVASLLLLSAGSLQAQPAAPHPGEGFIYATVTWPSGESKEGYLRWDDEEAFWDDLFHSGYRDLVWGRYVDLDALRKERRAEYFESHGLLDRLVYAMDGDKENPLGWRMFLSRFGDLRSIEIHDGDDDFAVTADGARHQIGGYANDAGSRLFIDTGEGEPERIRWNDLSEIIFKPAPPDRAPAAQRLHGRVETTAGDLEGFIQWDKSECTSQDILDGKEDNRAVDLAMGAISKISRTRENSVLVVMRDGAEHRLEGSNDVNSSNRGIMVEVANLARVTVPWNRFEAVVFNEGRGSGPGRESFANSEPLRGRVGTADGQELAGRLVVDLDEAWRWDLLNGTDENGFEYDIPFALVRRIEPGDQDSCRVTLQSGRVLELGDNQDTGREHGGILVFETEQADPVHILWKHVRWVEFEI